MLSIDPRLSGVRRVGADRKLTPAQEREVIAAFAIGDKLRAIETRFGISKPTIYAILDRNNVDRTKRNAPEPHELQGRDTDA